MTMIERVARALFEHWLLTDSVVAEQRLNGPHPSWEKQGEIGQRVWLEKASAAIEAILKVEPTHAMMEAMWSMKYANTKESFALCWQAMIDAALEEAK